MCLRPCTPRCRSKRASSSRWEATFVLREDLQAEARSGEKHRAHSRRRDFASEVVLEAQLRSVPVGRGDHAPARAELALCACQPMLVPSRDHNAGSRVERATGGCEAHAMAAAGDECDVAVQVQAAHARHRARTRRSPIVCGLISRRLAHRDAGPLLRPRIANRR
jgi:hypothetical protein